MKVFWRDGKLSGLLVIASDDEYVTVHILPTLLFDWLPRYSSVYYDGFWRTVHLGPVMICWGPSL